MRRFNRDNHMFTMDLPAEFLSEFQSLELCSNASMYSAETDNLELDSVLPPKCTRGVFRNHEVKELKELLSQLTGSVLEIQDNSTYLKYSYLQMKDKRFSSCLNKDSRHCIALAKWRLDLFGSPPTALPQPHHPNEHLRPVKIHYFAKVAFTDENSSQHTQIVAALSWYAPHPSRTTLGSPAQVWCISQFESSGIQSFAPLECLIARCAYCTKSIDDESVLVIVPEVY